MRTLYGLILAGGSSRRMGQDKAALTYEGRPQLDRVFSLLARRVARVFVSMRNDQKTDSLRSHYPHIVDELGDIGPAAGILTAHEQHPDVAWLVLACDLPFLDIATLDTLIEARKDETAATAFRSEHDGLPEPFCTIWEPAALETLKRHVARGRFQPRRALLESTPHILSPRTPGALANVNTPEERAQAEIRLSAMRCRDLE